MRKHGYWYEAASAPGYTPEPWLTIELEDDTETPPHEWTAKAMNELARQLGAMNDYYFPLLGAASMLKNIPATAET